MKNTMHSEDTRGIATRAALYGAVLVSIGMIPWLFSGSVGAGSAVSGEVVTVGGDMLLALGCGFLFFAGYAVSVMRLVRLPEGIIGGALGAVVWAALIFVLVSQ